MPARASAAAAPAAAQPPRTGRPSRVPDQTSPLNQLAHRPWEGILELNPTTATFYGDTRYADRLEDPSPEGRARARALMERTAAEAADIPVDGLSTEERITRDMVQVIGELSVEEDDQ